MVKRYIVGWVAIALLGSSCSFRANFDGTRYRCDQSGECPDGYSCVVGYCEAESPPIDASVAADADNPDPDAAAVPGPDASVVPTGPCGTMEMAALDFDDGTFDPDLFFTWEDDPATATLTGGELVLGAPAGATNVGSGLWSDEIYRMASSRAFIEVVSVDESSDDYVDFGFGSDYSGYLIGQRQGTLYFAVVVDGDYTTLDSIPYSASDHRWWQVREEDGRVYFETSPDGTSWTTRHDVALMSGVGPLVAVGVEFWTDDAQPEATAAVFDNLGGGTTDVKWCPTASLTDDFDDGQPGWLFDTWVWDNCMVRETGGMLSFAFPDAVIGECGIETRTYFDLSDSTLTIESPPAFPTGVSIEFTIEFGNGNDIEFDLENGNIDGDDDYIGRRFRIPFDPVAHRWLRFRGNGTALYWETSPDGDNWERQGEHLAPPLRLDRVVIDISGDSDNGNTDNIDNGFDNLNLSP